MATNILVHAQDKFSSEPRPLPTQLSLLFCAIAANNHGRSCSRRREQVARAGGCSGERAGGDAGRGVGVEIPLSWLLVDLRCHRGGDVGAWSAELASRRGSAELASRRWSATRTRCCRLASTAPAGCRGPWQGQRVPAPPPRPLAPGPPSTRRGPDSAQAPRSASTKSHQEIKNPSSYPGQGDRDRMLINHSPAA
jgi:hypothetical protein